MTNGEKINSRASHELRQAAEEMRTGFIRDAHETLLAVLKDQDDMLAKQSGDEQSSVYFVLEDAIHLPFKGVENQRSMTVMLKGASPEESSGVGESLKLFIPIPSDVSLDDHAEYAESDAPEFLVVRHINITGTAAWFVVNKGGVMPYIPDAESGEQLLADDMVADDISDELIIRGISKRIDAHIGLIAQLREELVNMTVSPQRLLDGETIMDLEEQ